MNKEQQARHRDLEQKPCEGKGTWGLGDICKTQIFLSREIMDPLRERPQQGREVLTHRNPSIVPSYSMKQVKERDFVVSNW